MPGVTGTALRQTVVLDTVGCNVWQRYSPDKGGERVDDRRAERAASLHQRQGKLTSAASVLPNCTLPTCPPNHRYLDRYTVSSVALVASISVVGVVKTGRLGAERKTTTVEVINRSTTIMDSVALDRMQPTFKHVVDFTLESASESQIAEKSRNLTTLAPRRSGQLHSELNHCVVSLQLSTLAPPSATHSSVIPQTNRSKGDPETIAYAKPLFNIMPALAEHFYLEVQYSDGSRVATTDRALTSFLRLRSYIFDLVTLDLHSLANRGHFKGVSELLDLIYGNDHKRAKVMLAHTEEEEEPWGLWWVMSRSRDTPLSDSVRPPVLRTIRVIVTEYADYIEACIEVITTN
ncbi:hypothetical protein EDB83DRAFT_2321105 [Lactarius deliciosus]|nr:hypothetical protein EDB83DRAFT_2321105 [Lactarius deliciosus]